MQTTQQYLPTNTLRRSGKNLNGVRFIVCHDTGNEGSTALGNVAYYTRSANEVQASAHTFIDDKNIIECIPQTEKAWHVRYSVPGDNEMYQSDANDYALGIELCHGGGVDNKKAYNNYVEYIAFLCKIYALNPTKKLVAHCVLDPMRRSDPLSAFKLINKTWPEFIGDVCKQMGIPAPVTIPADVFVRHMEYNSVGEDVKTLQKFLRKLGLFTYMKDTGFYYEITVQAVKSYQKKYGIPVTGKVDEATRKSMNEVIKKI